VESRVQKWGNSLAVRIPKPFASEVGLSENAVVELSVNGRTLVVTPVASHVYSLAQLLASVRRSNLHHETATGKPQGNEVW
jgi:antitoxin MazE